jgi:hypothetical protein
LDALDGIGFGWENDSNGNTQLRIERWNYFYKSNIILTLNDIKDIKRVAKRDNYYNQLLIGYKKYADNQEINALDSFHTEKNFTLNQQAIGNKLELLCDFIADPYAIELTRREALKKETSDYKYDEDIFLLELYAELIDNTLQYNVANGVINAQYIYIYIYKPTELLRCFCSSVMVGALRILFALIEGVG